MKLLVLQLSDIHFRMGHNPVLDRVDAIKKAVQGTENAFDGCLIAMTGDVAFSGHSGEYEIAHSFFDQLHASLTALRPGHLVEMIFIPGNHDCVLPENNTPSRHLIVDHLLQHIPTGVREEVSYIQDCLETQNHFFEFLAARSSRVIQPLDSGMDSRLYYQIEITVGGKRVRFHCYNTAWMSQRSEQPSQLLAPLWLHTDTTEPADLVLTLFHHPYNWLEPINAKEFRSLVERSSDIVMTGHEHVAEQYRKTTLQGATSEYFEGAVLQDGDRPESGFNVIVLDLDRRECQVTLYGWQDDHYAVQDQGAWRPFERSKERRRSSFETSEAFAECLRDAGAKFSHPHKSTIQLADIFVYPNLQDETYGKEKNEDASGKTIREKQLFEYIATHKHILIMGNERCGRTSLAKMLYADFLRQGRVPVFAKGEQFKGNDRIAIVKTFAKTLDHCVEEQYGADLVERFQQRDRTDKVLIIDDLHQCRMNPIGLNLVLECACEAFETIILLASDLFQIEEIAHAVEEQATLLSFRRCTIRPFGHRLRHKIIEKWYRLGREFTVDEAEIADQTRNAENLINTLLGKNLLPSYPLFVLTILQTYEASASHNTALGAYGYHYEALITGALARSINEAKSQIMVGTIYTFVAGVAFRMFHQNDKTFSDAEMEDAIGDYKTTYGMRFGNTEMLSILEEARVLKKERDGNYAFSYPFIYYYFVARYIHENLRTTLQEQSLRQRVADMTEKLYVEEYANVIIFLVYLTKDEPIINGILTHARTIYAEYEPCNLDSHLAFVSHLTGKPLPLQLKDGSLPEHNDEYHHQLDEAENLGIALSDAENDGRLKEDQELNNALRVNAALKTLEVMGQILRNFPGSLSGDLKLEIATESYLLGLRTLRAIYALMDENLEPMRGFFSDMIKHIRGIEDPKELAKATDTFLYSLIFGCSYGLIKRVSQAVGSQQLEETYKQITDPRSPVSIALIDLSIKLDHFRQFPIGEVDRLRGMVAKIPFAGSLLRCFVRDYFYLYPADYKMRQSVCAKLDIAVNDPIMLAYEDKQTEKKG